MNWQEGQRVECEGLDWGPCYVTMSNQAMVVIYCPRYKMVTTADPAQLEMAGWKAASQDKGKVIWLENWQNATRDKRNPIHR
jgi:hypothetical protein